MSNGQVFWIVFAILLAGPSTSGIVTALKDIAKALREANDLKRQELRQRGIP